MKNNHLSLILTSFLLSSSAMAMPGELSDAMNGIGKHDKAKIAARLHERADRRAQVLKQVRGFYGDIVLCDGGEQHRDRFRAVLVPLINKAQKARYQEEFYESYDAKGRPPLLDKATMGLLGQPPQSGQHIRMVRGIEALSKEVSALEATKNGRPALKKELEQTKEKSQQLLEKVQTDLEDTGLKITALNENKIQLDRSLEKYSTDITNITAQIREKEESIEGINEKINAPFQGHEEEAERLKSLTQEREELEIAITPVVVKEEAPEEPNADADENASEVTEDETEATNAETQEEAPAPAQELVAQAAHEEVTPDPVIEEKKQRLIQVKQDIDTIEAAKAARRAESGNIKEQYADEMERLEATKKELSGKLNRLRESKTSLATKIDKDVNEPLEKQQGVLQEQKAELVRLEAQIREVDLKLNPFDEQSASIETQLSQKRAEKQKLQDEADRHAIAKFVKYMNLYLAVPNDDFKGEDYEGCTLSTLSSEDFTLIQELAEARAKEVAAAAVIEAVNRETQVAIESSLKSAKNTCYSDNIDVSTPLQWKVSYKVGYNSHDVTRCVLEGIKEKFDSANMKEVYETDSPKKTRFAYTHHSVAHLEYADTVVKNTDHKRADRYLKGLALKWRARVSTGKDSLVDRMGLNSAFINSTYKFETISPLISLASLRDSLAEEVLKTVDTKADWKLARHQLLFNYDFTDIESSVHTRIIPILRFVEAQMKKEPRKEIKFVRSEEEQLRRAVDKMTSYMVMAYALTHDEQGRPTPELKMMSPDIEAYVKPDGIPLSKRVDNVMAKKALKWADRVWNYGQEFIKENGLKAWTFYEYTGSEISDKAKGEF